MTITESWYLLWWAKNPRMVLALGLVAFQLVPGLGRVELVVEEEGRFTLSELQLQLHPSHCTIHRTYIADLH